MKIKHIETMTLTFKPDDDQAQDFEQIRNQANAWMQGHFKDLFMGGYAFEQIYYGKQNDVVVEYTR